MTDPTPAEIFDERMGIVNMPDKNDMQGQQARADKLLADFAAGMNEAAGLPTIEEPGYVIVPAVAQHHIDTMTEQMATAQLAAGMDPVEVERKRIETRAAMQGAVSMGTVPDLETHLGIDDVAPPVAKWTTAGLIESAEILKRAIGEAEQALEAELAPMRAKLKEAEDALRAKALEQGETIKGAHIQVQIVAPSVSVKWDDKGLSGAVAMLPAEWRQAILAHRKTDEKPASTRIVYK